MTTMKPADRPENPEINPAAGRGSDDDYDFGRRVYSDAGDPTTRWRMRHVEEEHSLRLDVLRAAGLLG